MYELEAIGAASIFRLIRKATVLARMFRTFGLELSVRRTPWEGSEKLITEAEILKLQEIGQFLDDHVK